jgi:uncharacterized protein (TIGR02680 family)
MSVGPTAERFTLMRCGVISLFHYANQVFEAEDGHLLLRGANGSGKSTAVELIAPLLFDGNLSTANLSTADGHRSISYHLLLDGLYTRRLGYAWMQFASRIVSGQERWVTLALGVKQARDTKHDAWFLVWDTPVMIDPHLILAQGQDDGNTPIARREAAQLPGVELFDSAEEYRERVNALLFGFSASRYSAMIKLMRRLRSAQLGKAINVAQTTELLEQALPEIDAELLGGVGTKLDELESLRTELEAMRDAYRATARFVERYREFARHVVARELGAAEQLVRDARKAGRDHREAERDRTQAQAALEQAGLDLKDLNAREAHSRGELQALHDSNRWQAVERVDAARERARIQRERADTAGKRAGELLEDAADLAETLREAETELAARERELAAVTLHLCSACAPAGVADLLSTPLTTSVLSALDGGRKARRLALSELIKLQAKADIAAGQAKHERGSLDRLEGEQRELRGRRDEAEIHRDHSQGLLGEAVEAWVATLDVLSLDANEREMLLNRAEAISDKQHDLASVLDVAMLRVTRAIAAAEESWRVRAGAIEDVRAELERERHELLNDKDRPPTFAPWRDPEQPGIALWQVCDFVADLDAHACAGLERALEASGLLDARLDEDGHIRAGHGQLLLAAGAPRATGRTLADVLVTPNVPPALHAALQAVSVANADARGAVAVALDGSFSLGPMRGHGAKGDASFIGAAARQAARERRLTEIGHELGELITQADQIDAELDGLAAKRGLLQAERGSIPQAELEAVIAAWSAWRAIGRELDTLHRQVETQRDAARAALEAADAATQAAALHAGEHHLPPQDREGADALERSLEALGDAISDSRSSVAAHERWSATRSERAQQHERASERHEQAESEARAEAERAERDEGYAARLAQAAGTEREDVLAEAQAIESELQQIERRRGELHDLEKKQSDAIGSSRARLAALAAEIERLQGALVLRSRRLGELDGAGLLALALRSDQHPNGVPWDADRIASTWRGHRERLTDVPEVKTDAVYREFERLRQALDASLSIEVALESAGDVPIVTAAYSGGERPIAAVVILLGSELQRQEGTLAGREQQLFEEFLFGDVASELRTRIADADRIVRAASQKISSVRTSSGLGVDLQWELRSDIDGSVGKVIGMLRRSDPRALPPEQKALLMTFFRDRLAEARAGEERASIVEHLQATLDYRRWFRFRIYQITVGTRSELTRKAHSRDSGGEKSVTLHLPLLAAYHALLTGANPHAPRLVALDEAFAGIDRTGQQQLLEVLDDKFDMDFILTSEKLWCLEPQVHHLGVYQLRRYHGAPVAAVHWRWYGDERRKEMALADSRSAERV